LHQGSNFVCISFCSFPFPSRYFSSLLFASFFRSYCSVFSTALSFAFLWITNKTASNSPMLLCVSPSEASPKCIDLNSGETNEHVVGANDLHQFVILQKLLAIHETDRTLPTLMLLAQTWCLGIYWWTDLLWRIC
jgi:hypothetical protein